MLEHVTKRKVILPLYLSLLSLTGYSQEQKIQSIQISYFGEMVTHPGIKLGVDYCAASWVKVKAEGKGRERTIEKAFIISPTIGTYFHKRYQTGLVLMPEFKLERINPKGFYYDFGVGIGYLRTFIPNVYEVNDTGKMTKRIVGYNYFAASSFMSFGKRINSQQEKPVSVFIKPQFMYAVPGFSYGTGYFFLELGVKIQL